MKPKQSSPYSKMYLVTPSVYEKLLTCLDEKEKRSVEEMNIEKDIPMEERPAEKYIEMLTKEELEPQSGPSITPELATVPEQQIIQPQIMPSEIIQSEIIQPQPQISPEPGQMPVLEEVVKKPHFIAPKGEFTCSVCLKKFNRSWGLKRHMSTVHKNLQPLLQQPQEISPGLIRVPKAQSFQPALLPTQQVVLGDDDDDMPLAELRRQIKKRERVVLEEEDMPLAELRRRLQAKRMQQRLQPPKKDIFMQPLQQEDIAMETVDPLKQPCRLQAEQFPEQVIYRPKTKVIVPQIRKSKNIGYRKKKLLVPQMMSQGRKLLAPQILSHQESIPMFEEWGPKKLKARTSSEAKFKEKPAKWRPGDQDFPSWQ